MFNRILPPVAFNREFQKLWWAQILASTAFNTLTYTLIIKIAELTKSNTPVSLFVLSFSLPALLFGLFAGVWIDRVDRRRVLIITNILRALLIPFFYLAEVHGFGYVYPLAIVTSIITQFFIPAETTKLTSTVAKTDLRQANSLFTFTLYATYIIGPVAAGPALSLLGLEKVSVILFSLFVLAALLSWNLSKDKSEEKTSGSLFFGIHTELFEGLRYIWRNSVVWKSLLLLTFSQSLVATVVVISPGYARAILGIPITATSLLILGPAALGMLLGALSLSEFGYVFRPQKLVTSGILLVGVGLVGLGSVRFWDFFVSPIVSAAVLLFILGFVNAIIIIPSQTKIQEHAPEELRGRIFGVLNTMINAASFLPILVAGVVADTLGVTTLLIFLGIAIFAGGFFIQNKIRLS